jgi:hypothetical protein
MTEQTTEQPGPVENHPCAACGQLDDHPMIHVLGPWQAPVNEDGTALVVMNPSFHYDCLPDNADDLWGLDLTAPQHAVTAAARDAALGGVHGAELRTFIESLPSDNDLDVEEV